VATGLGGRRLGPRTGTAGSSRSREPAPARPIGWRGLGRRGSVHRRLGAAMPPAQLAGIGEVVVDPPAVGRRRLPARGRLVPTGSRAGRRRWRRGLLVPVGHRRVRARVAGAGPSARLGRGGGAPGRRSLGGSGGAPRRRSVGGSRDPPGRWSAVVLALAWAVGWGPPLARVGVVWGPPLARVGACCGRLSPSGRPRPRRRIAAPGALAALTAHALALTFDPLPCFLLLGGAIARGWLRWAQRSILQIVPHFVVVVDGGRRRRRGRPHGTGTSSVGQA
jgi:hypothetical protein